MITVVVRKHDLGNAGEVNAQCLGVFQDDVGMRSGIEENPAAIRLDQSGEAPFAELVAIREHRGKDRDPERPDPAEAILGRPCREAGGRQRQDHEQTDRAHVSSGIASTGGDAQALVCAEPRGQGHASRPWGGSAVPRCTRADGCWRQAERAGKWLAISSRYFFIRCVNPAPGRGFSKLRAALDPWGVQEGPALALMRQVKTRFDPTGVCNPGVFVGGI